MKTEKEIRDYLADCKKAVKEFDKMQDSLQACKYEGIVEGLEFVLSGSIITDQEQSKLNKIAEWFLNQTYHKSANGRYCKADIINYSYSDDYSEKDIELLGLLETDMSFVIRYGRQDDCFNDSYSKMFKVDRDDLNEWDGHGLPDIKELSSHSIKIS